MVATSANAKKHKLEMNATSYPIFSLENSPLEKTMGVKNYVTFFSQNIFNKRIESLQETC